MNQCPIKPVLFLPKIYPITKYLFNVQSFVKRIFRTGMEFEDRHGTRILQGIFGRHQSIAEPVSQECSQLEQKALSLQTQYAKMEMEYFRKIKQLKSCLKDRNTRQYVLIQQITSLRGQFKLHQEEISKVTEQLATEQNKTTELKSSKKNSSPGLIKKSLENDKLKQKNSSPNCHQMPKTNKNPLLLKSTKHLQAVQKYSPQPKKQSPNTAANSKDITKYIHKQSEGNPKKERLTTNQQPKLMNQSLKMQKTEKSPVQIKKKNHSPKSNQELKGFLLNSLKNMQKEKNNMPNINNASPKKITKKSPLQNQSGKLQAKKQGKAALGKLKEAFMEAF